MKRLLIQTQLSNYDSKGKFILECDSGWQMVMGRVREMLKLNQELDVTVMGPDMDEGHEQCITHPFDINPDLWSLYGDDGQRRLHYFGHNIIPNALVTRYDLKWTNIAVGLDLGMQKIGRVPKWDAVIINDPMHLRNFKAMFHVVGGYQPKFFVHSHFVDVPECPKFPTEASLWLGQCEAALKADFNFWQCESAMMQFFDSMGKWFTQDVVDDVRAKSLPWDDGYSRSEIMMTPDTSNLRFDAGIFADWHAQKKAVIFVPNRIGGKGRSSDYTNCGKFMFDLLPKLRRMRADFVVICGNPSQKILNGELEAWCGGDGYVSLVPDAFNRDEFRAVATLSDIAVGLYDQDTYGGTAARECIELGCMPLWLDVNEYSSIAREANDYPFVAAGWDNLLETANNTIDCIHEGFNASNTLARKIFVRQLQQVIRSRCSYEATTPIAMKKMCLLPESSPGVILALAGGNNLSRFGDGSPPER
jgi:hypothetical protein